MARTGFTESPSAILSPASSDSSLLPLPVRTRPGRNVPRRANASGTMPAVKRVLLVVLLLAGSLAAAYGVFETRRERTYRRLIDQGEAALAAGNTSAAIEAFSGAVALKADSMLGYLRRGEAYRRAAASSRRAQGPAAGLRARPHRAASARAPRRRQRVAAPLRPGRRALPGLPRDRRPVAARALQAGPRALPRRPARRGDRRAAQGARARPALRRSVLPARPLPPRRRAGTPRPLACPEARAVELAPALLPAREELAELYGRLGRSRRAPDSARSPGGARSGAVAQHRSSGSPTRAPA